MYWCTKCGYKPEANEWMMASVHCSMVFCTKCFLTQLTIEKICPFASCVLPIENFPDVFEENGTFKLSRDFRPEEKPIVPLKSVQIYPTSTEVFRTMINSYQISDKIIYFGTCSFHLIVLFGIQNRYDKLMSVLPLIFYSASKFHADWLDMHLRLTYTEQRGDKKVFACQNCLRETAQNESYFTPSHCTHKICFDCLNSQEFFTKNSCPICAYPIDSSHLQIELTPDTVNIKCTDRVPSFVKNLPSNWVDLVSEKGEDQCCLCWDKVAVCAGSCGCVTSCVECAKKLEIKSRCLRCQEKMEFMLWIRPV